MKDEDYLVHNINKISMSLDKLNWNIGKLTAFLMGDQETIKKIEEAQKKTADKKE